MVFKRCDMRYVRQSTRCSLCSYEGRNLKFKFLILKCMYISVLVPYEQAHVFVGAAAEDCDRDREGWMVQADRNVEK